MPNIIISEGKTTNEAIENGLKQLGVSKDKVDIKVLENDEKRSFFSILAPRVVKVEIKLKEDSKKSEEKKEIVELTAEELDLAENNIRNFLDEFLPKIDDEITYNVIKKEYGLDVSILGDKSSILIFGHILSN